MYPIIEYSHMIEKNTAEFTLKDFAGFMKWWMKQKPREDLMSKKSGSYTKAMESRTVELTTEDIETVVIKQEAEIVADMGLTQTDIDALSWGITELLGAYDFSEMLEVGDALTKLGQELESLTTKGE